MTPAEIAGDPDILAVRATEFGRWVLDRCTLDGDCWVWKGSSNGDGYPQINTVRFGRGMPHRMLFERLRGAKIDARTQRLQNTCGNRMCCNPKHWRIVPPGRVIAEQYKMRQRGPQAVVSASGRKGWKVRTDGKGNAAAVLEARSMLQAGMRAADVAKHFGISKPTLHRWCRTPAYGVPVAGAFEGMI